MLFNKDTFFFLDVNVKSIFFRDTRRELHDKVMEGDFQAGFSRACYHVPLFVDNLPSAKKHSQFCRCTSVTFTPRNVA